MIIAFRAIDASIYILLLARYRELVGVMRAFYRDMRAGFIPNLSPRVSNFDVGKLVSVVLDFQALSTACKSIYSSLPIPPCSLRTKIHRPLYS